MWARRDPSLARRHLRPAPQRGLGDGAHTIAFVAVVKKSLHRRLAIGREVRRTLLREGPGALHALVTLRVELEPGEGQVGDPGDVVGVGVERVLEELERR